MMYEELTPEERAAQIDLLTEMTMWTGKHGYYREAGARDGRNHYPWTPVPSQDAAFQRDYDEGYSDGLTWYAKLIAVAM